ncbi:PhoH family protein [Curtobacterium sp. Leaf154]|uniref:PhoH family protein n=1 Tax=Curtobacterium sp. Leaf154 TaxID=1736277 RepID=UPI0006F47B30|nr:phosphate starvation-inducible protein PhoH [Curtobacterium sp. Leaf154]
MPDNEPAQPTAADEQPVSVSLQVDGIAMVLLLGPQDRLLKTVERQYPGVRVVVRGNEVTLTGPERDVARAKALVDELVGMVKRGQEIGPSDIPMSARILDDDRKPSDTFGTPIVSSRGKSVRPKTDGQRAYVDAIDEHTITFGIGPAGTGKTYLAMAKAVQALQRREVNRIILTRPAVEAGERLGFLPGTLTDKIDPYLRPLYDALNEMMDPELVPKLLAAGTVEVAPLAYMRGRTLNDSFVVLDEAQNTTPEQMKMFLTRLGFGSKMVITGDITQVDLPGNVSGLRLVTRILDQVEDIHFARLGSEDVVRHTLVGRIVDAYTVYDEERLAEQAGQRPGGRGTAPVGNPDGANRAERRGRPPQDRARPPYPQNDARGGNR